LKILLAYLTPVQNYQQPLDITVREGEEVYLVVSGTHDVYVTGNYVAFPDEEDDSEDDDEDDGLEGLPYDLSGDEDEDEMDESEDDELDGKQDPRITEVDSEEEAPKLVEASKKSKKRAAEEDATLDDMISKDDAKLSKKQAKKLKKNDGQAVAGAAEPAKKAEKVDKTETPSSDKKKVQFAKNLEQGPTGSPKVDAPKPEAAKAAAPKGPRNVSGVTVDDKKEGKGKAAKKGDRIEMRYIGKLKNGKVFDCK
jgi:FK506-binding nuclear protein